MKILITGRPGIGKTTLIKKVASTLPKGSYAGFFTEEIREKGERIGFVITSFTGASGIMAHVKYKNEYRVGKYGVDVGIIDRIGVSSIEYALQNKKIIIIDEIGKMELFSIKFQEIVKKVFNSETDILATIYYYSHPFTDELKRRNDVEIINITTSNRNKLPSKIINLLQNLSII
jgi:nucleoside-triphosphatase